MEKMYTQWESEGLGHPSILHTDNGGEFSNEKMNRWTEENNIDYRHGNPGHPQAQGAIERVVGTVSRLLKDRIPEMAAGTSTLFQWECWYVICALY